MASNRPQAAFTTTQGQQNLELNSTSTDDGQSLPSQPTDVTTNRIDTSTSASVSTSSEYATQEQHLEVQVTPGINPPPPESIAQYQESVTTAYPSGVSELTGYVDSETRAQQQQSGIDHGKVDQPQSSHPIGANEHLASETEVLQPTYGESAAQYQQYDKDNYRDYSYEPHHVNCTPQPGSDTTCPPQQGSDGMYPPQHGSNSAQQTVDVAYPPQQGPEPTYPSQQGSSTAYSQQQGSNTSYPPQQGSNTSYPPQQGSDGQQSATSTHPPLQASSYGDDQQWDGYGQQQYGNSQYSNWNSYSSEYGSKEGSYDGSYDRGSRYHEDYSGEYSNSYNERGWTGDRYQYNYSNSGYQQQGSYPQRDYPPQSSYSSTRENSSYSQGDRDYYRNRQYGSPNYRDQRDYHDDRNYDGRYSRQYDSRNDRDRGYQSRQSEDSRHHKDPRRPTDRPSRTDSKDTFVERRSAMLRRAEGSKGKGKSSRGPQIVQPHRITESTDPKKSDKSKQLEASFPKRNLDSFKIPKKKSSSSAPSPVKKAVPIPALDVKEQVKTELQPSPQSSPLKASSSNADPGSLPGAEEVIVASVPMDTSKPAEMVAADVKPPEAATVKKKQAVSSSSKGKGTTTSKNAAKKNAIPSVLSTLDPKTLMSLAITMQKTIEQAEAEKKSPRPLAPVLPPLTAPVDPSMLTPTGLSSVLELPSLTTAVTLPASSITTTQSIPANRQPLTSAQSSFVMSSSLATLTSMITKSVSSITPSTIAKSSTAPEHKIFPPANAPSLPPANTNTSTASGAMPPPKVVPSSGVSTAGSDHNRVVLATVINSQSKSTTNLSSAASVDPTDSTAPVRGAQSKDISKSISSSLSAILANALSSLPAILQSAAKTTIANLKSQPNVEVHEPKTSPGKLSLSTVSSTKPPSSEIPTSTDTTTAVLGKRAIEDVEATTAIEAKRVKTESESEATEPCAISSPTLPVEVDESQSKDEQSTETVETVLSKGQAKPKSPTKPSRKRSVSRSKKKVSASKHATSSSNTTVCCLCQKKDSELNLGFLFGPYKQTIASEPLQENGIENSTPSNAVDLWIHEECSVWTPGVCLVGGQLLGFQEAVTEAQKMVCVQCKGPGATLCCSTHKCKKCYHYPCANDAKCLFDDERFLITCPKHSTTKE